MNQITINFTPCSPSPENGYRVFYREIGDVSFIEYPDAFTSSPIIFQIEGPTDQLYEGYIISDCGEDIISEQVPFETVLCPPPEGCCDPIVIDAEAETVIPDGSGSGSVSGGEFLRLVFNVDMSGESVSDWEVFFGTTFTSVVYSAGGTVVDLFGAPPFSITANLFDGNTTIVRVLDFADCAVGVNGQCFRNCTNLLEVDLPACLSILFAAFANCTAITDINLPLITDLPDQALLNTEVLATLNCPEIITMGADAMRGCGLSLVNFPDLVTIAQGGMADMENLNVVSFPNLTTLGEVALSFADNLAIISLPACTSVGIGAFRNAGLALTNLSLPVCSDLGGTTGDNDVFLNIVGNTIFFTLLTATATDTDVSILQANNSVTLILV